MPIPAFNSPIDPDPTPDAPDASQPSTKAKDFPATMSASLREATPNTPDSDSAFLRLSTATGASIESLLGIGHGVPLVPGVQVLRAELHLFRAETFSAGGDLDIGPLIEEWDDDAVTWNTYPSWRADLVKTFTVATGGVEGQRDVFEITDMIATLVASERAGGDAWNGLFLAMTGAATRRYWSGSAEPDVRPILRIEVSLPPEPADNLRPGGGRFVSKVKPKLRADFMDPDADDVIGFIRVQIDTDSTFDTPLYDSGQRAATEPVFDLANPPVGAPATPTLTGGGAQEYFWRMMVWDIRGVSATDWSEIESFYVLANGSLTVVNPSGATVDSPTPTFQHSVTGITQDWVEVEVEILEGDIWEEYYTFEQAISTATQHTLPDDYALDEEEQYRVTFRVGDNDNREDTADDRAFLEKTVEFKMTPVSVV